MRQIVKEPGQTLDLQTRIIKTIIDQKDNNEETHTPPTSIIHLNAPNPSSVTLNSCHILRKIPHTPHDHVVFFDLDNTLYSKRFGIAEEMGHRIQLYFQSYLKLPEAECLELGQRYYLDYGLAIKGLLHNFGELIDPDQYDIFVDGGLQLEEKLHPEDSLSKMLDGIQARKWVFTNAGLRHTRRVLRLLAIEHHFEGIIYCNYKELDFPAKPDRMAFLRAMQCADLAGRPEQCWFIDDSKSNVRTARELGWRAVHLEERPEGTSPFKKSNEQDIPEIRTLLELPLVFPELFPPK